MSVVSSNPIEKEFLNPSCSYRAKPFWSWNSKLEKSELLRQIRIFSQMGFGGFFMHSRVGLATPYLGDEWFDMIKACICEAEKLKMEAWLYDEDRWPSGAAGGLVTKHIEFRTKFMEAVRLRPEDGIFWPDKKDTLAQYVFAIHFDGDKMVSYRRVSDASQLKTMQKHEDLVAFNVKLWPNDNWFNGYTYLDTLNKKAVAEFINVTHEQYKKAAGKHFGKLVPGMFTDEPCHGPIFQRWIISPRTIVWTDSLPQTFHEQFGYDITEKIPELFYDSLKEQYSQARHHYHRCTTRMFVEAFSHQIGDWCQQNNLMHTGHVLEERPLSSQAALSGSAMQFYQYMQAPGIDNLTKVWDEYIVAKQCASVVRQMGRKWMLSELYGCTGWHTTFATYKFIGDWQAVLGITLRCPHLSWYSMAGESKRDYPASIHFQSPWWKHYHVLEDYYARLGTMLSQGRAVCDLAVLHPIESYGLLLKEGIVVGDCLNMNNVSPHIGKMDDMYEQLAKDLLKKHIDFDFVDEHLLTELDVQIEQNDRTALRVGLSKYKAILVPPMLTMRSTTLELLKKFADAGGKIIFAGDICTHIEALPDERPQRLAKGKMTGLSPDELERSLAPIVRNVNICDNTGRQVGDILYQLRKADDKLILFVVNTNQQHAYKALNIKLSVPEFSPAQIQLWDAMTANRSALTGTLSQDHIEFSLDLEATGSALIVITAAAQALPAHVASKTPQNEIAISPQTWQISLDDHNVLVLDQPSVRATSDGRADFVSGPEEILRLDSNLRDWLQIPKRGGSMIQPWAQTQANTGPHAQLTLKYEFDIEQMPRDAMWLAFEQAANWQITINGKPVATHSPKEWWVDPAIQKIPIAAALLRTGRNTLELAGKFDFGTNLEIVYILGNFGVSKDNNEFAITHLSDSLKSGSWIEQCLPFYGGNVLYQTTFQCQPSAASRYVLRVGKHYAAAIEVFVNDKRVGLLTHGDYSVDVTDFLKAGTNSLELLLLGSRRNSMGPLHLADDDPVWVGPEQFRSKDKKWQPDYKLVDYGIYEPLKLLAYK